MWTVKPTMGAVVRSLEPKYLFKEMGGAGHEVLGETYTHISRTKSALKVGDVV